MENKLSEKAETNVVRVTITECLTAARCRKGYRTLEPYEGKLSRTVLRRGRASNRSFLFDELFLIRELSSQNLSISEISRQTGFDRKTVRKYLNLKTLPGPQKRPGRKSKLDPFKPYILEKLNEGHYTAARLYREIKEMGFDGGKTIVKDFIKEARPKQGVPGVLRYETKPGVQVQVDWGELGTIEVDGKLKKLFCFNMILGYSRMRYVEFTLSTDTPTLIQCHLNAFEYFGGFTQEILYDNMKQVVIRRALKSSDSEWNSQFEDFFKCFGFIPRLCRPYRPQTKGKIENTVVG